MAWNPIVCVYVIFPRSSLSEGPVAFRIFEVPNLCTRIRIHCGSGNETCRVGWDQGYHIVNGRIHGFIEELGLDVVQVIDQSGKMFLQDNPGMIDIESTKEGRRDFTYDMDRGPGHDAMIFIDHANHLLGSFRSNPHLKDLIEYTVAKTH